MSGGVSLTVRPRAITRDEYDAVPRVMTTAPSVPREGGSATIAEISRADRSRISIEARRMTGGAMRYFMRDETLRAAADAAGSDVAPLDIGEEAVVTVSYGDADGDGHNDILLRTADSPNDDDTEDQFYVIASGGEAGEIVSVPEEPVEDAPLYDPEPSGTEPRPNTQSPGTGSPGGGSGGTSPTPPPAGDGFHIEHRANISNSARGGI